MFIIIYNIINNNYILFKYIIIKFFFKNIKNNKLIIIFFIYKIIFINKFKLYILININIFNFK